MNKKLVIGIVIAIIVIIMGIIVYINNQKENKEKNNSNEIQLNNDKTDELNMQKGKKNILVVYYSAQSHTKLVSEKIAKNLGADIFEIVPEQKYTSEDLDWTNDKSRVSIEHDDETLRNVTLVTTRVDKWEDYDTILIGYPIWWGIAAWPVDNFIKENDFTGKTIIPFCTSSSSGLGQSGIMLEQKANSGIWLEGYRFNSNPSDSDIKNWIDSLK